MSRLSVFALAFLSISAAAPAPGSCGPWVPQTNGTSWRMCVDERNQQYCELRTGNTIQRMQCP
jgi:hypothetical protein